MINGDRRSASPCAASGQKPLHRTPGKHHLQQSVWAEESAGHTKFVGIRVTNIDK